MKKIIFFSFLFIYVIQFGFTQSKKDCKKLDSTEFVIKKTCVDNITKIEKDYSKIVKKFKIVSKKIDSLKAHITDASLVALQSEHATKKKLHEELTALYKKYENSKNFCDQYECIKESVKDLFQHKKPSPIDEVKKEEPKPDVYIYFGDDEVIKDSIVDTSTTEGKIFYEVLKNRGEKNYIGDITIPKENQAIKFYKKQKKKWFQRRFKKRVQDNRTYELQKVEFEIKDGIFSDVKAHVKFNGETHIFQNVIGLSMLNFHKKVNKRHLYYRQSYREQPTSVVSTLEDFLIPIGDILTYDYAIGNNYIPHDIVLKFPMKDDDGKSTNVEKPVTFQIKQETYLDKILELRVYTDFLSVFGDSPNGLVQVEGNAKFYIFPFPFRILGNVQMEFFPELFTNVQYSRFDNENRYVTPMGSFQNMELDLIEKRFLTMGIEGNLLSFSGRNNPLALHVRGLLDYQLTEMEVATNDIRNVKSLAAGVGFGLEVSRFNNFDFSFKTDWSWHNFSDFNKFEDSVPALPNGVPVFRNEAEISYHPNKNPNQAIFVRLNTFNYRGNNRDTAFYQFQFGYKFSIGSRTINK